MLTKLQNVFAFLHLSHRKVHAPRELLRSLPQIYSNGSQQDATEFAKYLLDRVDASSSSSRTGFQGVLRSEVECQECQTVSMRQEKFTEISVSFPPPEASSEGERPGGEMTLERMLEGHFSPEDLSGPNAFRCSKCGKKTRAVKRLSIRSAPEHLIVNIKRH
eukprot:jgi/Bigna1/26107/gw1.56.56.1